MRRLQIQTFIDLVFLRYRWEPIITSGLHPLFPSRPPLLCQVLNVVGNPQPLLLFLWPTLLLPRSPCRAILDVVSWPQVSFYWTECDVCGASYFRWELKTPLSLCEPIRHDYNSSQRSDSTNFHNCYHVFARNALFLWITTGACAESWSMNLSFLGENHWIFSLRRWLLAYCCSMICCIFANMNTKEWGVAFLKDIFHYCHSPWCQRLLFATHLFLPSIWLRPFKSLTLFHDEEKRSI
jgi:hypothetical protein